MATASLCSCVASAPRALEPSIAQLAAAKTLCKNESGTVFIFKANPEKYEPVGEIPMGNAGFASPVACGGRLYLRVSEETSGKQIEKLYSIGRPK